MIEGDAWAAVALVRVGGIDGALALDLVPRAIVVLPGMAAVPITDPDTNEQRGHEPGRINNCRQGASGVPISHRFSSHCDLLMAAIARGQSKVCPSATGSAATATRA